MDDSITVPQHAVSPPAAHSTGTLPSPSQDVVVLFARKEINVFKNNKQTNISPAEILPFDKRSAWYSSERPGDECVVDRSDGEAYILSEMASALRPEDPDHSTRAEKRSGSCSFIWLNRWSRAAMVRSERRRVESSEVKPPQQTSYGPDRGAPPSSSCTLSEPH